MTYDLSYEEARGCNASGSASVHVHDRRLHLLGHAVGSPTVTVPADGSATVNVNDHGRPVRRRRSVGRLYGGWITLTPEADGPRRTGVPVVGLRRRLPVASSRCPPRRSAASLRVSRSIGHQTAPCHVRRAPADRWWDVGPDRRRATCRTFCCTSTTRCRQLKMPDRRVLRTGSRSIRSSRTSSISRCSSRNSTPHGLRRRTRGTARGCTTTATALRIIGRSCRTAQYKIVVKALKALGDPGNPAHWETWTSPTITIDRP